MFRLLIFVLSFLLTICLCSCNGTVTETEEKYSKSDTVGLETLILTDKTETGAEINAREEEYPIEKLSVKGSTGYYRYSFGGTEIVLNEAEKDDGDRLIISEGDRIGALKVEKIISCETQKQVFFSGEMILSGVLYRENGRSDLFSDRMDLGWLLFFPDPSDFPTDFPILQEYVEFEDKTANFSLSACTEPLLLIGEFNDRAEDLFHEGDYIWAEIRITDIQLRNGLEWFLIPYESTVRDFEILSAKPLDWFTNER